MAGDARENREAVAAFALRLPGTQASTSYGQPAITVATRMVVSTGRETASFHVRAGHDDKARVIATDPERARRVIARAWWDAAGQRLRAVHGPRP